MAVPEGVSVAAVVPPLTSCRQAIADAAATNTVIVLQGAFGWVPGGECPLPFAFVQLGDTDLTTTDGDQQMVSLELVVAVNDGTEEQAQRDVDALLTGAGSITQLLRADKTFGGTCTTSAVRSSRSLNKIQVGGMSAWGHMWAINVWLAS